MLPRITVSKSQSKNGSPLQGSADGITFVGVVVGRTSHRVPDTTLHPEWKVLLEQTAVRLDSVRLGGR